MYMRDSSAQFAGEYFVGDSIVKGILFSGEIITHSNIKMTIFLGHPNHNIILRCLEEDL
jgi:hypothetical protein